MIFYECYVSLAGDRNAVVRCRYVSTPELQCLQAIHGVGSVTAIKKEPSKGIDKTSHAAIRDALEARYGRVRVGADNDPRPLLPQVFPGWPNVTFARDAEAAGIDPLMMVEDERPRKTARKAKKAAPDDAEVDTEALGDTSFAE